MTIFLALGSNRGPRAGLLAAALAAMPAAGINVRGVSCFRRTVPVQTTSRALFLNAVAEASTSLLPHVLLRRLQHIERGLGRHRLPQRRNAPRTCDLDIIFYGRVRLRTAALAVPHPRFSQRRFVVEGLAELAPGLRPPGSSTTMRGWLRRLTVRWGRAARPAGAAGAKSRRHSAGRTAPGKPGKQRRAAPAGPGVSESRGPISIQAARGPRASQFPAHPLTTKTPGA